MSKREPEHYQVGKVGKVGKQFGTPPRTHTEHSIIRNLSEILGVIPYQPYQVSKIPVENDQKVGKVF